MCVVGRVAGVTQLRDVIYVLTRSTAIRRYNATTHQRLTDIDVTGLRDPRDIAACELTSRLYVADLAGCVWRWRVSFDSEGKLFHRRLILSETVGFSFRPSTLSVTSARLLVTSHSYMQLRQFDAAGGDELRRVYLDMDPCHAVESPTGTFIVSHLSTGLEDYRVSELSTEGRVLRQFSSFALSLPQHIAVDRYGNILVADSDNDSILLLDAELVLCSVFIDKHELNYRQPYRLCYMDQSGQLLVGFLGLEGVAVFQVLRRWADWAHCVR